MLSQIIPGLLGMMGRFLSFCAGASAVAGNHLMGTTMVFATTPNQMVATAPNQMAASSAKLYNV